MQDTTTRPTLVKRTYRLPADLVSWLTQLASHHDVTETDVVRLLLRHAERSHPTQLWG